MVVHDIELKLPAATTIRNADATIKIYADEQLLGRLGISRGSIDWRPGRGKNVRRMRWARFDRSMQSEGNPFSSRA